MTLLGVVALSGISFEARAMESDNSGKALLVGAGLGAAALGAYYLKNTKTYEQYQKHNARLAQEKDMADNAHLYAQPLSTEPEIANAGNEKLDAYLKKYELERNAYNQQTKKNPSWNTKQIMDSYEPDNQ